MLNAYNIYIQGVPEVTDPFELLIISKIMVAKILKLLLFGRAMFSLVFYLWYPRYLSSGYLSACLEFDPSSVIMSRYSKEEKIRNLQTYTRTTSITETQRDFRIHFKTRISPTKNTIKSVIRKFEETGAVNDKPKTGRTKSVRTEDLINRVATDITNDPKTSIRKRSSQLSISRSQLSTTYFKE